MSARARRTVNPISLALGLYYFFYLGALGFWLPFFTAYLTSIGLEPSSATRILAMLPVSSLVAPPLMGWLADSLGARTRVLRLCTTAACLSFLGFFLLPERVGPLAVLLYSMVALIFAFFRAPLLSLVDAMTHEEVRRGGPSYGRIRLWGSIGFLLAASGGGRLAEHFGLRAVLGATAVTLLATTACAFAPLFACLDGATQRTASAAIDTGPRRAELGASYRTILGDPALWPFLIAVALGQVAGAAYDGTFSLHLLRLGHGMRFVGVAWSVGVFGEVVLMAGSGAVLQRIGPRWMLFWAYVAAVLRWGVLAHLRSASALLLFQPLHGITFGWFYVAGTTLAREHGDTRTASSVQGWFVAAYSLGGLVGLNLSGILFERFGGGVVFSVSAAVASVAAALAYASVRLRAVHSA